MSFSREIRKNLASGRGGTPRVIEGFEALGIRGKRVSDALGINPVQYSNWKQGIQAIPAAQHAALVEHLKQAHVEAVQALGEALVKSGMTPALSAYRLKTARAAAILGALEAEQGQGDDQS